MENNLKIFEKEEFGKVSTLLDEKSNVWFIGKEIAKILGYKNSSRDINRHVDEEDRKIIQNYRNGTLEKTSNRGVIIINESGLYSLILSSKLPKAKGFKHWITSEVLPSIRKTGTYSIERNSYMIEDPIERAKRWIEEEQERQKLRIENSDMKPKAEFYDTVTDSKTAIPMDKVAKILDVKGMGRNNLFEFLRKYEILQSNNSPYQKYVDSGYFRVIEKSFKDDGGETKVYTKTLVYQKGVDYIRKLLKKHNKF